MTSLRAQLIGRAPLLTICGALLLGLWLRFPSVDGGFRSDDYVQVASLRGHFAVRRAASDLYRFDATDTAGRAALRAQGYHPWWADPGLELSMWRPLPSLLLALDHALFDRAPLGYHLHSMLWWLLLVAAAALCLRQCMPAPAAAVGTLLFALDECHNVPVAWLANRNTLVAGCFGLLALALYLRAEQGGGPRARLLARWAPLPALAAGEYALGILGFIVAHALLTRPPAASPGRLRRALPAGLWTLAFLVTRQATGHGIAASGYYISPLHQPGVFVEAALVRVPRLLANAVFGLPVRMAQLHAWLPDAAWARLPGVGVVQVAIGGAALALLAGLVWHGLRARPTDRTDPTQPGRPNHPNRTHAWLAAGIAFGCIPAAGSLPEERLLVASSFGVCALLAPWTVSLWARRARIWPLAPLLLIALAHGISPALAARAHAVGFAHRARTLTDYALAAPMPDGRDGFAADEVGVYLLSGADFTTAANLVYVRDLYDLPQPAFYRRLSGAQHAHDLRRVGERVLEVTVLSSRLAGAFAGSLYRGYDAPLRAGDSVNLPGLTVEVLGARRGQAWKLRYTFNRSLDDPRLRLMHQYPDGLRRVALPPVGETLRLPRPRPAP